jgi:ParB-like nuclease domain
MIVADLASLAAPLDKFELLPGNPRVGDVDAIARSLDAFGQRKPIVARRDGTVVAGNHTLLAARRLGWSEIAAVWVDDDDTTAHAFALADNRTAELGGYDDAALVALIESVRDDELLAATGWDDQSIAKLVERIDADAVAELLDDDRDPFSVYDREQIIDVAFEHYRRHGFPYRQLSLLDCMQQINQLAATPTAKLLNTNVAYHVADTYHPHRWDGFAETMYAPTASFAKDKQLFRAFKLCLEYHGGQINDATILQSFAIVGNTQACSNFRPGFALALYREFCTDGAVVFDTSTGYGGRLVGFVASQAGTYIGVDPSTKTHEANARLAADLAPTRTVRLINQPAEDVDPEPLAGSCDFAFTSPPYFTKEHYADEDTQSFKRYPQPAAWRDGFLVPMMRLQHAALAAGAVAAVNIADVDLRGRRVPLEDWTRRAGIAAGFELVEERRLGMPRAFESNATRLQYEPVFIFRKPA